MPAPLWKPSPLDRLQRKVARQIEKAKAKRAGQRSVREAWAEIRRTVYVRDGGRCRATGMPLKLHSANPFEVAETHHIVYRSAGGSDELANLVTVCRYIHDLEHRHILSIGGDGNRTVTFTRRNLETGEIERQWESTP